MLAYRSFTFVSAGAEDDIHDLCSEERLGSTGCTISSLSEEATFTMPRNSSDGELLNRFGRLETKIDHYTIELQRLDKGVASLEPKLDYHSRELLRVDRLLDSLRTLVEERTSAARTVTWVQLGALLFVLLLPIGGGRERSFL